MTPRRRRRFRLGVLTGIAIAGIVLLAVAALSYSMNVYGDDVQEELISRLSPDAEKAFRDLRTGTMPEQSQLQALVKVLPGLDDQGTHALFVAGVIFSLIVTALCGALGFAIAHRIAAPIRALADIADRLSAGDYAVTPPPSNSRIREIADLNDAIARLTGDLSTMERRLKFNTMAVAHELRTPLTILRGRLQGIADGVFQPEPRLIGHLIASVEGLARLVDDLRTLSLAETGNLIVAVEPFDLADLVRAGAAPLRPLLHEDGITLDLTLASAHVLGDRSRIQQILLVFIDNARRYAVGTPVIDCDVRADSAGAHLTVADRGPGFPAEFALHGIDLFWRGDSSRARATGGTGLGLSIAKAIATAHGGALTIRPRDGGGSCVTLTLPLADAPATPPPAPR